MKPLQKARQKSAAALADYERYTQKAEQAKERWIKWGARIDALQNAESSPASVAAPASTEPFQVTRDQLAFGSISRVAESLKVHRAHVCRVASGQRRSPRVEQALRAEVERVASARKVAA